MNDRLPTVEPRSNRRIGSGPLVAVAVLLVGYVLSMGPVGRLFPPMRPSNHQPFGSNHWESAYAPLLWVTDRSQLAAQAASWYLEACGGNEAAWRIRIRRFDHCWLPGDP